ncbi:MAG TPA: xanthine dehydrogenase small subunit [Thauera sp.]|uniref:xanthine dehydrogenase small subunit n=1 Tax=Thauera sp. TaxID=1905334 RepID=UPI002CDEFB6F|nr:xanthine dehydrogenase small subunit [Thauera sp.]HRP26128.1 xanthine dehydrogenase small subunit [Thauera sp.]HRP65880.1 xanthine dehydrogenase small subunit [Thauera sp.]
MNTDAIRFLLNGEPVEVTGIAPTTSLLAWLRIHQGLTGTKEGCAEGDCGACTVVLGELAGSADALRLYSVNACIQFVPALDGKAVFTVEYLRRQAGDGLHPVQQAMVDCHGSQCGFCTPGFVMSLWDLYNACVPDGTRPDPARIRSQLTGNLCRCTGYRPIIEAGERMFEHTELPLDREAVRAGLLRLRRREALDYVHEGTHFLAPRTLAQLVELRRQRPQATLLAGCTDIGLWVNKQFRDVGDLIYIGQVEDLQQVGEAHGKLRIGAAVSLSDAFAALCLPYPELGELWERFASPPVRNAGTLGGNVANGSPIGDSMPALIALGAEVVLHGPRGRRSLPLDAFYLDYMRKDLAADEIVEAVEVPVHESALRFRSWKVSKRFDSDISAVCGAFALRLEDGVVRSPRIAFGGMAATPRRALRTEAAIEGRRWDEAALFAALQALAEDYAPLSDLRASADYRRRTAAGLLRRFYLETRAQDPLDTQQTRVFAAFDSFAAQP